MPEEKEDKREINYGGFWVRFFAFIIDSIIISLIFSPILDTILPAKEVPFNWHFMDHDISSKYFYSPSSGVRNVLFLIYSVLMLYYYNTTLGKMIMGLKITDIDGKRPDMLHLIIRETFGKFLSAIVFGLGFITAGFSLKKQAWHDKLAQTYIIYGKPSFKK